jgi:cell division protein FtsZ
VDIVSFGEAAETHERPRIRVFGCGGAGCNILELLHEEKLQGIEKVAVNRHLEERKASIIGASHIPIEIRGSFFEGSEPDHAETAAWNKHQHIEKSLQDTDLAFILCGLGGVTGTGTAPAVASMAKSKKVFTVALAVQPFSMEGVRRARNREWGMNNLNKHAHAVVSIENDRLLRVAPDASFGDALKVCNMLAMVLIREISSLLTRNDLKAFRDVIECREVKIGYGLGNYKVGLTGMVDDVMDSLMPEGNISEADRALIMVRTSDDIPFNAVENLVGCLASEMKREGKVLWGRIMDNELGDEIHLVALFGKKA